MGWLFLAPALFANWRYRYFAYWKPVLAIGGVLFLSGALFSANGTLDNPSGDGIVTGLVRQATGDGPQVLFAVLGIIAGIVVSLIFLKQAHAATLPPHPGRAASKGADVPRKIAETLGLIVAVFVANIALTVLVAAVWAVINPKPYVPVVASGPTLESEVRATAAQITDGGPQQIDEITRLDRASANSKTLTYHYTLDTDAPQAEVEQLMAEAVTPKACADPDLRSAMQAGALFRYAYTTAKNEVAAFSVSEIECSQLP